MESKGYFSIDKDARAIYLYDYITPDTSFEVLQYINHINCCETDNKMPIKIYIDSPGGEIDAIMGLLELIISSDTPIETYCMGDACSLAFLIFISGHKRFMAFGSRLVWHSYRPRINISDVKSMQMSYAICINTQRLFNEFIMKHTNIPKEHLDVTINSSGIDSEIYIDTTDAIKYGCTDIIMDK